MDVKEALESDEGKAAIAKAVEEATKPLLTKRDELLGEVKKLKGIQDQLDELKAAKEAAEEEAANKSGDVDKIKATLEAKHKKELDALTAKLDQSTARLNQTLIDKGLSDALVKANVAPHHLPAVTALIKATAKAEISDEDGNAVAKFDGKTIEEFVTGWAQGDTGKHYIAAPNNGGGGAGGSNGGGKAATGKKADMTVSQKAAYIREHGAEAYDKLA